MRFVFVNTITFLRKIIIKFKITRMICFYVKKRFIIKKNNEIKITNIKLNF